MNKKLMLLAAILAMVMVAAAPVLAYHEDSPYPDSEQGPPGYDGGEYPPGYDEYEYGTDWSVEEVTDEDCDEETGTCEYEGVGEILGYPAELEWQCTDDEGRHSPYDEGGHSPYYGESCTLTEVDLL
jgi:hypothetical protein